MKSADCYRGVWGAIAAAVSAGQAGAVSSIIAAVGAEDLFSAATDADRAVARAAGIRGAFPPTDEVLAYVRRARPKAAAFQRRFPQILLVLPGAVATCECRFDDSRFFARLDRVGCISDGWFG